MMLLCMSLYVSACGADTAQQLPTLAPALPLPAPPAALAMIERRVGACTTARIAPAANVALLPAVGAEPVDARYNSDDQTITLYSSAASLADVDGALSRPDLLREEAPGQWLLNANLMIAPGGSLRIAAPDTHWLKLRSDERGAVNLEARGGKLVIEHTCITSWDTIHNAFDEQWTDKRASVLARRGGMMTIHAAELSYLGYRTDDLGTGTYGVSWMGTDAPGEVTDSTFTHNFFGLYTNSVIGLVIRGNNIFDSVLYGIDPHTSSRKLLIEGNSVHDNGKHGIILAEDCTDTIIRDNITYNNLQHGIVLYQSNNNAIVGNTSYSNAEQGINLNDSSGNMVQHNVVYDNADAGIGVGQKSHYNTISENETRRNGKDGIVLYGDTLHTTIHSNTVRDNARAGVYIKDALDTQIERNVIANNGTGVLLQVASTMASQSNTYEGNRVDVQQAPTALPLPAN
jgi:parallel beta-helix repeat protein